MAALESVEFPERVQIPLATKRQKIARRKERG